MLITEAFAQGAAPAPGGGDILLQLMPFVFVLIIFYFLLIRPQQRRMKHHQEMISNLRRGDVVVTSGGLIGKIAKVVDESEVVIELADDVRVRVVKSTIAEVRTKSEPVKE